MENQKNPEDMHPDFKCGTDENGHTGEENIMEENITEENSIAENTVEENDLEEQITEQDHENETDSHVLKIRVSQEIKMMMNYALRSGKKYLKKPQH